MYVLSISKMSGRYSAEPGICIGAILRIRGGVIDRAAPDATARERPATVLHEDIFTVSNDTHRGHRASIALSVAVCRVWNAALDWSTCPLRRLGVGALQSH